MENKDNKRNFFSIIIPCYNTKTENIQRLLRSIEDQNMSDDIEIIISNDRSTETDFLKVVEEYIDQNKLNIKIIDVPDDKDLIHCPGNTRETGVSIATGEWITFVDHDDELISDTFKDIKKMILRSEEQYVVSCNFYEVNPYDECKILNEFVHTGNWMHGKFYNLDNFWKAKNFHFKSDLQTHEDIYISCKTICELHRLNRESPTYLEIFCLKWYAWKDSTSRLLYNKAYFVERFFADYIKSTIDFYLEDYIYAVNVLKDTSEKNVYDHIRSCIDVLMYLYFYVQGFKFRNPNNYVIENEFLAKLYVRKVYETFGINADFIYECVIQNNSDWYNRVRDYAKIGAGNFIETYTFYDFLTK